MTGHQTASQILHSTKQSVNNLKQYSDDFYVSIHGSDLDLPKYNVAEDNSYDLENANEIMLSGKNA